MKCLLCNVQYDNLFGLQQYFIEKHEVDENNYFFKRLFVKERYVFVWNKCPRCEHYYLNSRDKVLFHYQLGGRCPFESRPIQTRRVDYKLTRYFISFDEYSD